MTTALKNASDTFPVADRTGFKRQLLAWASTYEVACYLDHNHYQNYPYSEVEALVGVGVVSEIFCPKEKGAFEQLKSFSEKNKDWLFGFLTYDLKNDVEDLTSKNFDGIGFPALHFFRPKAVVELSGDCVRVHSQEEEPFMIYQEIINASVHLLDPGAWVSKKLKARIPKSDYLDTVQTIRRHIRQGDIYEMNFCQEFFAEGAQIQPPAVFHQLNQVSKAPFSAFYKLRDRYLLCASPERFLKKTGRKLITQPIKGTIRRGQSKKEDAELRERLFRSQKDRSENVMIVDLVRNDLSRSCQAGSVKVEELYGTYAFEQVHQLISTVSGTLREEVNAIDALRNAFPMGSMTGAPKVRSMQLIEKYEQTKRGLYSGAVGYRAPNGDFDFNVVIRSILFNESDEYLSFQVGGAIVYDSSPAAEYDECLLKAKGMFSVVGPK
jgi:para-aminobenzoate synthetase component 1